MRDLSTHHDSACERGSGRQVATWPRMPCHLVVFVIVNALNDVNLAGLGIRRISACCTHEPLEKYSRMAIRHFQWSRKQAKHLIARSAVSVNMGGGDVPQPHGALLRSKINSPVLYWAWLDIRTLKRTIKFDMLETFANYTCSDTGQKLAKKCCRLALSLGHCR